MRAAWIAICLLLVVGCEEDTPRKPRVLFLTHSAGYVHRVVKRALPDELSHAERRLVEAVGERFEVTATQDVAYLGKLATFDAVVFYTTGELPVDDATKKGLIQFVRNGGGFVGIHCATDTFYEYAPYGEMTGAYFDGHPWNQKVRIRVEDQEHPATKHLGHAFEIHDEIYQFKAWSRADATVLLSLDVKSVDLETMGVKRADKDFATAWCKEFGEGRVFYTALGHHPHNWEDERFLTHVVEGIAWSMAEPEPPIERKPDADGFVPLFDATVGARGWKQAGPGRFEVADGVATPVGGMGLWYFDEVFEDFVLRLEFRQNAVHANSGVFVRFPRVNGDPWLPVNEGYEIQIQGDEPSKHNTGAVYTFKAPSKVTLKTPGEWNAMEIRCEGQTYAVWLNGERINEYVGDRATKGMIGLQNHQDWKNSVVCFRNVRIKELRSEGPR